MRLSANFSLEEFCVSQTATRMGREIIPNDEITESLQALVTVILQPLREVLDRPIMITSGYRPEWLNLAIGGSLRSQHMKGQAADFVVPGMSTMAVCHEITQQWMPFDQLIQEFGKWVHVSHSASRNHKEILTASHDGTGVVYSRGLV